MQLQFFDDSVFGVEAIKALAEQCGSDNLDRLAYLIVTPDAIHRKQETEILDYLCQDGFEILGVRLRYLDDRDVEYLYKYGIRTKIFKEVATHWHVTRLGLTTGISAAVLVRHPSSGAVARLRGLKGESDPLRARGGTIRGDMKALSKTLALIHSPDDISNFLREVGLVFSLRDLEAACGREGDFQPLGSECVEAALVRSQARDSLARTAGILQARLLRYLAGTASSVIVDPVFDQVTAANREYLDQTRGLNLSAAEELLHYSSYARRIRDSVETSNWQGFKERIMGRPGVATLQGLTAGTVMMWFEKLTLGIDLQYADLDQLRPLMRACGINHDEWEMVRLKNFCFFIGGNISSAEEGCAPKNSEADNLPCPTLGLSL